MINNDDEYAFPLKEPLSNDQLGMTLRDYFAAKAMQGELASQNNEREWNDMYKLARYSYDIADAMIEARKS